MSDQSGSAAHRPAVLYQRVATELKRIELRATLRLLAAGVPEQQAADTLQQVTSLGLRAYQFVDTCASASPSQRNNTAYWHWVSESVALLLKDIGPASNSHSDRSDPADIER